MTGQILSRTEQKTAHDFHPISAFADFLNVSAVSVILLSVLCSLTWKQMHGL